MQNTAIIKVGVKLMAGSNTRGGFHDLIATERELGLGFVCWNLAKALAIAGGMLMIGIVVMTVISVFGRYLFNAPIPGDYEITELASGVAVFTFFPYCYMKNANIVVEFFTGSMNLRWKRVLDTVHHFVFAMVAGLVSWRLYIGGMNKLEDGETTLFLGIPIWIGYFSALPGAILLTAVCIWGFCLHLRAISR